MKSFKMIYFCSFYVIPSLNAKKCVCRSNRVAFGQYEDKEEKTMKKSGKGSKSVIMNILENKKKETFLPIAEKIIFSEN